MDAAGNQVFEHPRIARPIDREIIGQRHDNGRDHPVKLRNMFRVLGNSGRNLALIAGFFQLAGN